MTRKATPVQGKMLDAGAGCTVEARNSAGPSRELFYGAQKIRYKHNPVQNIKSTRCWSFSLGFVRLISKKADCGVAIEAPTRVTMSPSLNMTKRVLSFMMILGFVLRGKSDCIVKAAATTLDARTNVRLKRISRTFLAECGSDDFNSCDVAKAVSLPFPIRLRGGNGKDMASISVENAEIFTNAAVEWIQRHLKMSTLFRCIIDCCIARMVGFFPPLHAACGP